MSKIPVQFREVLQLSRANVAPENISFAKLTLESDRFVCVREAGAQNQIAMIPVANPSATIRRPISADQAIMNPQRVVLALAAGNSLQVFDMEGKSKLDEQTLAEPVVLWHWISADTIGIVTAKSVYHWKVGGGAPKKMFDRIAELADAQIINYKADKTCKWLAVTGIAQRNGQIVGQIQLYSVERGVSQPIEGHACAFADFNVVDANGARAEKPTTLFIFAQRNAAGGKMFFLPVTPGDADKPYQKVSVDVPFPPDAAGDFPVSVEVSEKYEMAFLLTKAGYMHMLYLGNGKTVYRNRISNDAIFISAPQPSTDGLVCITRRGQMLSLAVDPNNIVPFILTTVNDFDLAAKVAARNNLPGAEDIFLQQFNSLLQQGNLKEAAAVAFRSPGEVIRNAQTIQRIQQIPAQPGQPAPLLLYFGAILDLGRLNQLESLELTKIVVSQGRLPLIEKWLQENKFECSEAMGDVVRPQNQILALQIYAKGNAHAKVVQLLGETGQQDKIAAYCARTGYNADFKGVLATMLPGNPAAARQYAAEYFKANPNADPMPVMDEFQRYNLIQDLTSLMLDVLKEDKPEHAAAQTRILEISLIQAPAVADAILGNNMFHHYNRQRVGQLCEQAGLYQRALEHYTEMKDIRRVMMHAQAIKPEFLVEYFAQRSVDESLELLNDLLHTPAGPRANLQVVVQICLRYQDQLTATAIIALFEKVKCYEGIYYFLNQVVGTSEDPEVHYKYIEAAIKTNQFQEVERMCRESNNFDPARVRDLLKESKLQDQFPFIIVCDRFGFVEEMARYLYQGNHSRYIQAYVQKINPGNTPQVVGALLDAGCNEEYIKALILSVSGGCPIDKLVEAVASRNRLKIILPWLEARAAEGNTDVALHNALAMCYVDMNNDPEKFLDEDMNYDARVVGAYCESRDPYLAFVAYRHGNCDDELLRVTNEHSLFKYQAQYLVKRMDAALWARVLSDEANAKYKRSVVDQVVQTALPECESPDEVKETVKAFMAAEMHSELIELLEKIVLDGTKPEFSENRDLQNLLILTAIKANQERVMEFVTRLNNYDAPNIANVCVSSGLAEEGFTIFSKFKHNAAAIQVLIEHIKDLKRAKDFADKCNEPEVYSRLAKAQLDEGQVADSIASYIKANDHEMYVDVIAAAEAAAVFEDLIKYLLMCRKNVKDSAIETELIYAYAKTNHLAEIEEFISQPNSVQIQDVGDRCFSEELYEAAKLLYASINNHVRLASTLLRLKDFAGAVEAAKKANSTTTWREVTIACLDASELKLAHTCALNIIIHSDEIGEIMNQYVRRAFFKEAIELLEQGITLEKAHPGMYTELAILYSKFQEEKLLEFIRTSYAKMQPQKVIRTVRDNQQWKALTLLYVLGQDFDHAAETMMDHAPDAWDHVQFRDAALKVIKTELLYRAVDFYLAYQPTLANEFLQSLVARLDPAQVVAHAERKFLVPLIKPYLVMVQTDSDVLEVNEALNALYVEEGDHEELRRSIELRQTFDQPALAQKLEKNECLEMRRIGAYVLVQNKRFRDAVELAKKDELWSDAMAHAARSGDSELAEELLRFFVEKGLKSAFAACLFVCYSLLSPDVVLELGWLNGLTDLMMPFMIQSVRQSRNRVQELERKEAERVKREEEAQKKGETHSSFEAAANPVLAANGFGMLALPAPTADPMMGGGMPNPMMGGMPNPMMGGMPGPMMGGMPGPMMDAGMEMPPMNPGASM